MKVMVKGIFRFKRFEISHARSSMRVGTDAVLLGAWASDGRCSVDSVPRVLDVGCGCGLIALMLAQRSVSADITGVDIDAPSVEEAQENAAASPFAARLHFLQADIRDYAASYTGYSYTLIVSNPPYYTEDTLPPQDRRSVARNAAHLSFDELLSAASCLLDEDGRFSVVIPMQSRDVFVGLALLHHLHLCRECRVQTVVDKPCKRVLLEFALTVCNYVDKETLVLQEKDGRRTAQYQQLCGDFYL